MTQTQEIKLLVKSIDELKAVIPTDGSIYALERTKDLAILHMILHREVKSSLKKRK